MIKQYIRQSWQLIKQYRFFSAIYITGTGLSIALVMVIAIVYHIKTADMTPEINRNRLLISERSTAKKIDGNGTSNANLSFHAVKECFYTLETPECVATAALSGITHFLTGGIFVCEQAGKTLHPAYMECTDANFWKVFGFNFMSGHPYTEEEFQSGITKAVISESLSRKIFGSTDTAGNTIEINGTQYIISGVVKDVSPSMTQVYADLWVPLTCVPIVMEITLADNLLGFLTVFIMAEKTSDFDAIRAEVRQSVQRLNSSQKEYTLEFDEGMPYSHKQTVINKLDFQSKYKDIILRYSLVAFIFLLVPAINLSGLTSSRMQERISEIGIRKTFGANRATLITQIFIENFILTLLGGIVGLCLSYLIVWGFKNTLITEQYNLIESNMTLSPSMLINYSVFFYALCFCILLNIISSLIPVWNSSRKDIIDSLNNK